MNSTAAVTRGAIDRPRSGVRVLLWCMIAVMAWLLPLSSHATQRDQAKRVYDRIAGVPPDETTLTNMVNEMNTTNAVNAALLYATEAPEFYSVTLKNFVTPWTNEDRNIFVPLNDYTATVIGMVRDDADFRELLSGNYLYIGSGPGIPAYNPNNNAHYEALEAAGTDLQANLQRINQSQVSDVPDNATAGVMTTRSSAQAFLIDGTNRALFRDTMKDQLCRDMEQVKDITRVPDRIRQDVSRSPGGDSRIFLNNCIGCHSGMDPLIQAFAYYDFVYDDVNDPEALNGAISYNDVGEIDAVTGTRVTSKYFNNNATFEHGFITTNDDWANYWRAGLNSLLGWNPTLPGSGTGAKSMGQELANSDAFAQCQVEKVFANVCLRPPQDSIDRAQVDAMVTSFRTSGFNLKQVFAESAVYCMGD